MWRYWDSSRAAASLSWRSCSKTRRTRVFNLDRILRASGGDSTWSPLWLEQRQGPGSKLHHRTSSRGLRRMNAELHSNLSGKW